MIDILQQYGFSEKEAKVYIACLQLGNAPGSTIARYANEKRVTVYTVLKELLKKGYATEITRNGIKFFSVMSPDVLLKQQEEKYALLKSKLPEFLAIADKIGNKPKVQFFEGLEGIKQVCEQILIDSEGMPANAPLLSIVGSEDIHTDVAHYFKTEFPALRKKYSIKTRSIVAGDHQAYSQYNAKTHTSIIIDDPLFQIANEIVVFGTNKVAMLLYNEQEVSAVIIESTTLHQALTSMFMMFWKVFYKQPRKGKGK